METLQTLVVPATPEGLSEAERGFDEFATAHGLTRNDTWPFHVALDEVLSNIVEYGCAGQDGTGRIEIELRLETHPSPTTSPRSSCATADRASRAPREDSTGANPAGDC